jgi:hypothetical protein
MLVIISVESVALGVKELQYHIILEGSFKLQLTVSREQQVLWCGLLCYVVLEYEIFL